MKKLNVYFNSCFTQTAEAIKFLKKHDYDIKIFITNTIENSNLRAVADYYEIEDKNIEGLEYANYCVNFCKKHNIDIFFVRYKCETLCKYKHMFDEIGVKATFVTDFDNYIILNNKAMTYEAIRNDDIVNIPPYKVVTTFEEYKEAYNMIKREGFDVCLKPVVGIGAVGFKVVKEHLTAYEELQVGGSTTISKERLDNILKNKKSFDPIMVLGYLDGEEYSVDCLANNGELIDAIPRVKVSNYVQFMRPKKEYIEIAKKLSKKFNLSHIFNFQIKYHNDKIYLIEINTRMSGGIFKACSTGVNIMTKELDLLLGRDVKSDINNMRELKISDNIGCYIEEVDF